MENTMTLSRGRITRIIFMQPLLRITQIGRLREGMRQSCELALNGIYRGINLRNHSQVRGIRGCLILFIETAHGISSRKLHHEGVTAEVKVNNGFH